MMPEMIRILDSVLSILFFLLCGYQFLYIPVSLFFREKPPQKAKLHRYAVLIAARNEEAVIRPLLDSIRAQDYPAALMTVFVCADNCCDRTARFAREGGAVVYERFDRVHVGKGYALHFLLSAIERDFGAFDGYFVFDADNLLKKDYISRMNETFSQGFPIVTSYRNSKNFGDNWISAGYALWFLREARYLNQARALLGTSCAVSGTGFLFSRAVLEDCGGWNFFTLTEDIEFTIRNVLAGQKIGYCGDAEFFDEQPTAFSQSWQQRMRWARGYLQVFRRYGLSLLRGIFSRRFLPCFDMTMLILPAAVLTGIGLTAHLWAAVLALCAGQDASFVLFSLLKTFAGMYLTLFLIGALTMFTERRHIALSFEKKIRYTFTFPLFMMTYVPISISALLFPVRWKPIRHRRVLTLAQVMEKRQ